MREQTQLLFFSSSLVLVFILSCPFLPSLLASEAGGVHGISNGLILGIQTWKVLQDPKEFRRPTTFQSSPCLAQLCPCLQLAPMLADSPQCQLILPAFEIAFTWLGFSFTYISSATHMLLHKAIMAYGLWWWWYCWSGCRCVCVCVKCGERDAYSSFTTLKANLTVKGKKIDYCSLMGKF